VPRAPGSYNCAVAKLWSIYRRYTASSDNISNPGKPGANGFIVLETSSAVPRSLPDYPRTTSKQMSRTGSGVRVTCTFALAPSSMGRRLSLSMTSTAYCARADTMLVEAGGLTRRQCLPAFFAF
jgi:hypothetical protein